MDCAATDCHTEKSDETLDVAQINATSENVAEIEESPDKGLEHFEKSLSKINYKSIINQTETATTNSVEDSQQNDAQLDTTETATEIQKIPDEHPKHSEKSLTTLNYVKRRNNKSSKSTCIVCCIEISNEDVDTHILEKGHAAALLEHGCDKIILNREQDFYCKSCCCKLSGKKRIYRHVKKRSHLQTIIKLVEKNADGTENEIVIPPIVKNPVEELPYTNYVITEDEKRYFCLICDPLKPMFVWYKSVEHHIKNQAHKSALVRYGCEYIFEYPKNKFRCKCCDMNGLSRTLARHLKSDKHLFQVDQERSVVEPEKNPFGSVLRFQRYIFTVEVETPVRLNKKNKIVQTQKKISICKICGNNKKSINVQKLRHHITGETHAAFLAKYGCERIFPDGDEFCCRCCNCGLSTREIAYDHVTSENHLRNVAEEKTRKLAIKEAEKNVQQDDKVSKSVRKNGKQFSNVEGKKSSERAVRKNAKVIQQKDNQVSSKASSLPKLSCIYVVKVNSILYKCQICSDEESTEIYQMDFRDHIVGRRHRDALKKYGCDSIVFNNDNNIYYCRRCELELGSVQMVFLHIKEETHLKYLKVPYCQNMISNFMLEKNATDSQCEVDKMILDMTEQILDEESSDKAENRSGEGSNRDLDVHFISCDPLVLCKGAIRKSTKHLAVKIVKQHADDPYCLICDFEIPGFPAIDDHIMGKCHANSLIRYGCDYIFRESRKRKKIVCRLCSLGFLDIEAVFRHIKTKAHLRRVNEGKLNGEHEDGKKNVQDVGKIAGIEQLPREYSIPENCKQENGDLFSGEIIPSGMENQKPPQFNTILSSLSADLSRMLAHMEVSQAQPAKDSRFQQTLKQPAKQRKKNDKRVRRRKMRFKQTSPDRDGGYSCSVCNITLPRKEELHIHMTSHFSEDFVKVGEHAESVAEDKTDSDSETEDENSSNSEDGCESEGKIVYNFSFK